MRKKVLLRETLNQLTLNELKTFQWYLRQKLKCVINLKEDSVESTIDVMVDDSNLPFPLETTVEILEAIPKKDLAQKLREKLQDRLRKETEGASGDHRGRAPGDHGDRAPGDHGGRASGDHRGRAPGDHGGRASGDHRGRAPGDHGG